MVTGGYDLDQKLRERAKNIFPIPHQVDEYNLGSEVARNFNQLYYAQLQSPQVAQNVVEVTSQRLPNDCLGLLVTPALVYDWRTEREPDRFASGQDLYNFILKHQGGRPQNLRIFPLRRLVAIFGPNCLSAVLFPTSREQYNVHCQTLGSDVRNSEKLIGEGYVIISGNNKDVAAILDLNEKTAKEGLSPEERIRQSGMGEPEDRLGGGAFSEVWRVRKSDGQPAAVKAIQAWAAAPEAGGIQQIESERQVLTYLQQRGAKGVVRIDTACQGKGLLGMELVPGEHLDKVLSRLLPEQGVAISRAVIENLFHHVHAHGVVHRDIKTENYLLDKGNLTLTDFAGAKIIGYPESAITPLLAVLCSEEGRQDWQAAMRVLYNLICFGAELPADLTKAKAALATEAEIIALDSGLPTDMPTDVIALGEQAGKLLEGNIGGLGALLDNLDINLLPTERRVLSSLRTVGNFSFSVNPLCRLVDGLPNDDHQKQKVLPLLDALIRAIQTKQISQSAVMETADYYLVDKGINRLTGATARFGSLPTIVDLDYALGLICHNLNKSKLRGNKSQLAEMLKAAISGSIKAVLFGMPGEEVTKTLTNPAYNPLHNAYLIKHMARI